MDVRRRSDKNSSGEFFIRDKKLGILYHRLKRARLGGCGGRGGRWEAAYFYLSSGIGLSISLLGDIG